MMCDNCKLNEATIHYTEVINGVRKEHHLCQDCMQELGGDSEMEFPLSKLIRGILSAHLAGVEQGAAASLQLSCDKCGMTYEEFMKLGKFGCAECYNVFGPMIVDNIKKLQGNSTHTGKKYASANPVNEFELPGNDSKEEKTISPKTRKKTTSKHSVEAMQRQLKKALEIEDYEEAARLRDAIKSEKEREHNDV